MKRLLLVVFAIFSISLRASDSKPLDFQEVYSLIRTNLADLSAEQLSRTAAIGLIKELGNKVQLVTTNDSAPPAEGEPILRRAVYHDNYGYIAVKNVDARLPEEFQKSVGQLTGTNSLKGLVIDLRYAEGQGYEAAAKVADLFLKGGEKLLKLGGKEILSTDKSSPLDMPAAVLVNHETSGAAEALAAALRQTGVALIIGSRTAGEARLFETFTLSTGQKLRIGKIPVEAGDKTISAEGLAPDIAVQIDPAIEKLLYQDPYRAPIAASSASGTNQLAAALAPRPLNEAELVRRHRQGEDGDFSASATAPEQAANDRPIIRDPALARALDFLKGISVLEQRRPR